MTRSLPDGLRVTYQHIRETEENNGIVILPRGGQTVARIFRDDDDVPMATGIARCAPSDNYNKRLGRTIALGRALRELEIARRGY